MMNFEGLFIEEVKEVADEKKLPTENKYNSDDDDDPFSPEVFAKLREEYGY